MTYKKNGVPPFLLKGMVVFVSVLLSFGAFAQQQMLKWSLDSRFQMDFTSGSFQMFEDRSYNQYPSTSAVLLNNDKEVFLSTDGINVYDETGNVIYRTTPLSSTYTSNMVQLLPRLKKKDTFSLFYSLRGDETGGVYVVEISKSENEEWLVSRLDTVHNGMLYGQEVLFDSITNCYQIVAYDPNFELYSIRYCACGVDTVMHTNISVVDVDNQVLGWFPQVIRFSKNQKKVFLEAPNYHNIPEQIVLGDYNMETGGVDNRQVFKKEDLGINDIRDAEFSLNNRFVYYTGSGQLHVYRLEIATGEIMKMDDPAERDLFNDQFYDLEMGPDGMIYISDFGGSVKSVVDYWRIVNPDKEGAFIELVYRNEDYKKYPKPPEGKNVRSLLPDFPPFLYDENYSFPVPLEVATPELLFEATKCFADPVIISNGSAVVDSTVWELWKGNTQLQAVTTAQLELDDMSPGSYTAKATNYIQCIDGETATLDFELDSFPSISLNEDTLVLCNQNENKQEVYVKQNTNSKAMWNTTDEGDTIVFQGGGVFVATVENNCGIAKATIIQEEESLTAPNIITPNGDGKNEAFIVEYSEDLPLVLHVVNRWGGLAFESNDYKNDWSPRELTTGVYYYTLKTKQQCEYKGWLQIQK